MVLSRQLEAEVVDTLEEALAYDAIDHEEVNRRFVGDLLDQLPGRGPILDLGMGTARIPIQLCRKAPDTQVVGIDLSFAMIEVAGRNVAHSGLAGRIAIRRGDAKRLPFPNETFSAVISNSFVHHVAAPGAALREAWRVLASGGLVFMRDLIRPIDEPALENLLETYAPSATDRQRRMFEESLRAGLSLLEIQAFVEQLDCPAETVRATSDRHWTWAARKGLPAGDS